MPTSRDKQGRFKKVLPIWTPEHWNDGWIDNQGRFRIFRPDYPRAYQGGYALRAHVVWWLAHKVCHPPGTALHHKNGNKTDDRLENLQLIPFGDHTSYHCKKPGIRLICKACGEPFTVPKWRINQRCYENASLPQFCSQQCYHMAERTIEHKQNISKGLRRAWAEGKRTKPILPQ